MKLNAVSFTALTDQIKLSTADIRARTSQIHARAARRQQLKTDAATVTKTLNQIYAAQSSRLPAAWRRLQSQRSPSLW